MKSVKGWIATGMIAAVSLLGSVNVKAGVVTGSLTGDDSQTCSSSSYDAYLGVVTGSFVGVVTGSFTGVVTGSFGVVTGSYTDPCTGTAVSDGSSSNGGSLNNGGYIGVVTGS